MNELKPCPFCGGKAEKTVEPMGVLRGMFSIVRCTDCSATLPEVDHTDGVVEAKWNTRHAEPRWIPVTERLPPIGERYHANHYSGIEYNHAPFVGTWDDEFRREVMLVQGYTHWKPVDTPPEVK